MAAIVTTLRVRAEIDADKLDVRNRFRRRVVAIETISRVRQSLTQTPLTGTMPWARLTIDVGESESVHLSATTGQPKAVIEACLRQIVESSDAVVVEVDTDEFPRPTS